MIDTLNGIPGFAYVLSAFGAVTIVRLFLAPYWVYQEAATQRDLLRTKSDNCAARMDSANAIAKLVSKGALIERTLNHNQEAPRTKEVTEWQLETAALISKLEYPYTYFCRLNLSEVDIVPESPLGVRESPERQRNRMQQKMVHAGIMVLNEFVAEMRGPI